MASKFIIKSKATDYGAAQLFKNATFNISGAMQNAAQRLSIYVPELLTVIISDAARQAGSEAFPAIYLIHTIAVMSSMYRIEPTATNVSVTLDFGVLGNYQDLTRGFHYNAIRRDGTLQELPYTSGNFTNVLKNPVETRYIFWNEVVRHSGLQSDTLSQRVAAWGDKAPEWLLLQYGTSYSPQIQPYPILENIGDAMTEVVQLITKEELYAAFAESERAAGRSVPSTLGTFAEEAAFNEGRVGNRFYKIEKMNVGKFANTYIGGVFAAKTPNERLFWLNQLASLRGAEFSTFRSIFRSSIRGEP